MLPFIWKFEKESDRLSSRAEGEIKRIREYLNIFYIIILFPAAPESYTFEMFSNP